MRRPAVALLIGGVIGALAGALSVVSCTAFSASASDSQPDAASPPEAPVLQFSCGTTECLAGTHACCQVMGTFGCYGIAAGGCPSASGLDAGPDGAPPGPSLLCTTYRNCNASRDEKCCYRADQGSSCRDRCENGFVNLCTLNADFCGQYADCRMLTNSPAPNVGQCVDTGSSGTSGWSGSGGGGGSGGFP